MKTLLTVAVIILASITLSAQVNFTVQTTPVCSSTSQAGEASFNVTSGTPPYSYEWYGPVTGSGTSNTITGLPAGNYNVTVTDALSASNTRFFTIDSIFVEIHVDTSTICDGRLFIHVEDNNGFYGNLTGGYYDYNGFDYIISDNNTDYYASYTSAGCTVADTFNSGIIPDLETNVTVSSYSCETGAQVSVELIGSNPTDAVYDVFVEWDRFSGNWYRQRQNSNNVWDLIQGSYIIYSKDTSPSMIAQCPDNFVADTIFIDADTTVAAYLFSQASITASIVDTCSGMITLTGNPAFLVGGWQEYTWMGPNGFTDTGQTITISDPHAPSYYDYSLQINTLGCWGSAYIYDHELPPFPDSLSFSFNTTPASCSNNGSATVTPYGFSGGLISYLWSTGDTTATINNISGGNYYVVVSTPQGCVDTGWVNVLTTSFDIDSVTTSAPTCASSTNGSISVYPAGGSSTLHYNWSNGDTTATINNLSQGTYQVTVSDTSGCTHTQLIILRPEGLQVEVSIDTFVSCSLDTSGVLSVTPLNGIAPYSYIWSNGNTDSIANHLAAGGYTVTVTDGSGCSATFYKEIDVDPACYVHLEGTLYADLDSSCTFNTGDLPLPNSIIVIEPGFIAYTDPQGHWEALVDSGGSYLVYPEVNYRSRLTYGPNCNIDTLNINTSNVSSISGLDLPRTINDSTDISVSITMGNPVLGRSTGVNLIVCNYGYLPQTVTGSLVLDDLFTTRPTVAGNYGLTIDSISNSTPFTIYYHGTIAPQVCLSMLALTVTPGLPSALIGQTVVSTTSVYDDQGVDVDLSNNTDTASTWIVGAYDPNDKQVFSNEEVMDGLASPTDTLLEYKVRFQNTGNYHATDVIIKDTLDSALDPTTFRLVASSHPVQVQFYQDNIIHFNFFNIMLPDSNANEPESHGFVAYEIEIKEPGLLQNISNQAAIYFDFNPPIYTNTVTTVPAETPVISGLSELCNGETTVLRADTLSQFSYFWTNNGAALTSTTGDSLLVTTAGDYGIALVLADDTIWSDIKQVTINPVPTVTLTAASNSLCADASAVSITVSPTGGTLTGDGVSGTSFDPATAGVGAHQLTYEYTDGNNCSATAYETVTVNANPTATLTAASNSLCADASAVNINVSPTGGTLTGDGVSGTSFDPATAGVGAHQLTYEYTDGNNCSATAYETVTVNANPTATLTAASNSLCADASAVSINVSPTGGTLTGDGVSGTSFDPATAGVGAHQLTYEYTDGNNCSATAYETVTVNANPTATLTAASNSLCEDASAISLNVSPTGGTLTGDGISGTSFDPATAGVGAHQLTYEYTDGNNCSATAYETVTVNANPTATLAAASNSLCEDASAISITVSPTGGTLIGDGISGTSFDPATAGVGAHQLTYEYTDGNNCSAIAYETVTVNATPTTTFSLPSDPLCESEQAFDVSGYGSPAGGVFSGNNITGTDLDVSAAGTYSLTYTYTDNNGCIATAQASALVEVCIGIEEADLPVATIHPNPTNGLVTISVEGRPIDQVVLLDVTGKQIKVQPIQTVGQATLDLSDLASGMYMLHILSEGNWYTERVVLQQ